MPYLVLKSGRQKIKTYRLEPSRKIRIGRSNNNDITVNDSSVSSIHAELEPEGLHFYLTDFNSRNGTFVNKELVISRRLSHGDVISIGNHSLIFAYAKDEKRPPDFKEASHQATLQMDTEDHRARLAKGVAEIAEPEIRSPRTALISFLSEKRPVMHLEKPVTSLGKDPVSDIRARGWRVGKREALIEKTEDGYYLTPEKSKTKVKLNHQPLKEKTRLKEFDVIELGSTMIQFHY
jgi:pSer/pThr/pTyr-binding forkhead associated (FHA) protein